MHIGGLQVNSVLEPLGFTFSSRLLCVPKPDIILGFCFWQLWPHCFISVTPNPSLLNQICCYFILKLAFLFLCLQWSFFSVLVAYKLREKNKPTQLFKVYSQLDTCYKCKVFSFLMTWICVTLCNICSYLPQLNFISFTSLNSFFLYSVMFFLY